MPVRVSQTGIAPVWSFDYGMKDRSSGSGRLIGTSKKRLGSGQIMLVPSDARKLAACIWPPRAICPMIPGDVYLLRNA